MDIGISTLLLASVNVLNLNDFTFIVLKYLPVQRKVGGYSP